MVSCLLLAFSPQPRASLGPYEHGSGIKSQGAGGVSYAFGEESTPIALNPALAAALDDRNDLGIDFVFPKAAGTFEGNLLGPDETYKADGQKLYFIPQGGLVRHLNEHWSSGLSLFAAGLGPKYTNNPFQRFGGGPQASLTLGSCGLALALAWRPHPDHAFGVSINPGYQTIRVVGAEFLGSELPLLRVSATPDKTSNQGYDGRPNIGATFGWHGLLAPGLAAGAGYRTKTWAERHRDYRGLLPDRGSLELPAIWGGGLAWMPNRSLTLAYDFQRYEFAGERALGNRIRNLGGNQLGARNGPGFGFRNQDAHKFGLTWLALERLTLRTGYIHASSPVRSTETLFNILGSINTTTHYTAGFTWAFTGWEVSAFAAHAPAKEVRGENSIPLIFGGGEANTKFGVNSFGLSAAWGFGD